MTFSWSALFRAILDGIVSITWIPSTWSLPVALHQQVRHMLYKLIYICQSIRKYFCLVRLSWLRGMVGLLLPAKRQLWKVRGQTLKKWSATGMFGIQVLNRSILLGCLGHILECLISICHAWVVVAPASLFPIVASSSMVTWYAGYILSQPCRKKMIAKNKHKTR